MTGPYVRRDISAVTMPVGTAMIPKPISITSTARKRPSGVCGDVAVADRRQRHDRPVDAARNTGEAVLGALDEVHRRTDDHDDDRDGEQKDEDLVPGAAQRIPQFSLFAEALGELEDPEDPEHAKHADHEQVLRAGQQQADVAGSTAIRSTKPKKLIT